MNTGIFGAGTFLKDMIDASEYGSSPLSVLLGPIPSKIADLISGLTSSNPRTVARSITSTVPLLGNIPIANSLRGDIVDGLEDTLVDVGYERKLSTGGRIGYRAEGGQLGSVSVPKKSPVPKSEKETNEAFGDMEYWNEVSSYLDEKDDVLAQVGLRAYGEQPNVYTSPSNLSSAGIYTHKIKDMSNGELIERMENTRQEFGEFFNLKDKGMIDDSVFLDRQSTLTENMDVMAHELRHRGMEYADLQNEGKDVNVLKSDKNDELAARMGDLKHGDGIYKEMAQEYKESSRIIGPDRLYNKLEEDFREVLKDMRPQVKRSFLDKIMSYIYN